MQNSELSYFEEILRARKAQIMKNISGVEAELNGLSDIEMNDEGDYAAISNENMVDTAIGTQQGTELLEIELALSKITVGTYGICEMCEEPISFARLKVKPHARFCIDCREIAEKNNAK
ncbi:MAG: RNA polymerase-binding protein DksA [Campylobacterales bacterium]|nr:RNA polymerase-binding protein DksA [Campylobacterales bacterium]